MEIKEKNDYDVVIIGSGIAGSMLGAILAKHNVKVLLIESGSHPRYAIGEATTPDTSFRLKLLAEKYDVPEIADLSTFHRLRDNVSPACGIKRAFSFLYHREGEMQIPQESHQYPTLAPPMGPDCHFFRQDTDSYLLTVAVGYGAHVQQETKVKDIEFLEDKAIVTTVKGEVYHTNFVVDASGFKSLIADRYQLRADNADMLTNSRSIFTHMVNVKFYEEVAENSKEYGLKYPLYQSTLHHVFKGGWFWVIPFNNHADSVNPLCSVGLLLNRELHPETGKDAEEEFFEFVNKFPKVAEQFKDAVSVRPWVSTGRIQYHSKKSYGHRFFMLAHASGFIDPLFSSGMNLTAASVDLLAKQLLRSHITGDYSQEKFEPIDEFFQRNLKIFDEVVGYAFLSFQDFELWDAWFRVWVVALLVGTTLNANLYLSYYETKRRTILNQSSMAPYNGMLGSKMPESEDMLNKARAFMHEFRIGKATKEDTAANIRQLFTNMNYCPSYWKWDQMSSRTTPAFTVGEMTKMYLWYYFKAPKHIREKFYNWSPLTAYKYIWNSMRSNKKSNQRRKSSYSREIFRSFQTDLKKVRPQI
jgi:tetracycline 7-halogenase / FADH2 O2-dependent halogenase